MDARRTALQNERNDAAGLSDSGPNIASEIASQQTIKQTAQNALATCDPNTDTDCPSVYQTTIDDADARIVELQGFQSDISTEGVQTLILPEL